MKLLQINSVINTGSTGRIAEDIGKLAKLNSWESYIAYGRYGNKSESKVIKIGSIFNVLCHVILTRIFDLHGLASNKATRVFLKEIEKINPDIVHIHNLHGYYINYEILLEYLKTKSIPIVLTLHDCWIFTGHCAYYSFIKCDKWKTECFKCPQKSAYPSSIGLDNSRKNFNKKRHLFKQMSNLTIIPVSGWLASQARESFLAPHKIKVINNGVDLEIFSAENHGSLIKKSSLQDKFIILGVANIWDKRKGFDDFILLTKFLEKDEVIVLVGLNKKQIKNLPSNILGVERTESTTELAEFYSLADVFFNPTWEDNFPTTNIESLACGTPVITYYTGGSPEAVSKETGFVCEQGNLEDVVKKIRIIKNNGKEIYFDACRKRAVDYYNKENRYSDYIDLYKRLINEQNV